MDRLVPRGMGQGLNCPRLNKIVHFLEFPEKALFAPPLLGPAMPTKDQRQRWKEETRTPCAIHATETDSCTRPNPTQRSHLAVVQSGERNWLTNASSSQHSDKCFTDIAD
ncbi:hypothetical protein BaRGS_00014180 [Batillaria attramentaria]|uniref:Uncharacterized protein n=1 Tax=Batillaria attramentaria TaxID=370345 RepID=A0ABD0L5C5_9CAEN